ncbi:putative quinol monooxygenase [Sediminibacter sp. Hel_I_10]|uniref:putative quinol monooxygenase n=1 Tax=Sediminibacter sp. Hel_I_10 TaxID=1392490 RepID=UPI00047CBE6E|nr:antibiotic biosynthesis monooxygenase family protein [Sediminibacter sp. Hel_I_10]
MLIRIVKMSFDPSKIQEFLANFETKKEAIRHFEGCKHLELYRDKHDTNVFFTYSYWEEEADLERYRHSELFKGVWARTKPLFNARPEAWSVDRLEMLD